MNAQENIPYAAKVVDIATASNRRRDHKAANKIAPVVRRMVADAFAFRLDSEAVAVEYRISRLTVMDCVLGSIMSDHRRMMSKAGLRNDFGRAA